MAGVDILLHGACAVLLVLGIVIMASSFLRPGWALLAIPAAAVYGAAALRRPLRRRRIARQPFPRAWRDILLGGVPFYRELGSEGRRRFERDVRYFLAEQRIEGVDDVEITDEVKVLIAAGAAVLLHGQPEWELPRGHTILVYRSAFDETFRCRQEGPLAGQMHGQGPIIISLEALLGGWRGETEDSNVALHEFAHLMDMRCATAHGIPRMLTPRAARAWVDLVHREMAKVERGRSLLREYAATDEAEFFAVAVEYFFQKPEALRDGHPELYAALAQFFNQDPASRNDILRVKKNTDGSTTYYVAGV